MEQEQSLYQGNSIANLLYKKMMKTGRIQSTNEIGAHQKKKKAVCTKYDLSDKWIDDEEVLDIQQTQKTEFKNYKVIPVTLLSHFYQQFSIYTGK